MTNSPRAAMFAVAALAGIGALGAETPGAPDPARVAAGTYTADPLHTLVQWRVNHMGFNDYFGLFGSITGTLVIDPAHLDQARVAVRIPVGKITTASKGLTDHLLMPAATGKPDYFGPKPADALFTSTKVTPASDGRSAAIDGKLTLNGVTRPVTLTATFSGAGKNPMSGKQTLGFHATTSIKRSEWNLGEDVPLVSDTVDLQISAAFQR